MLTMGKFKKAASKNRMKTRYIQGGMFLRDRIRIDENTVMLDGEDPSDTISFQPDESLRRQESLTFARISSFMVLTY